MWGQKIVTAWCSASGPLGLLNDRQFWPQTPPPPSENFSAASGTLQYILYFKKCEVTVETFWKLQYRLLFLKSQMYPILPENQIKFSSFQAREQWQQSQHQKLFCVRRCMGRCMWKRICLLQLIVFWTVVVVLSSRKTRKSAKPPEQFLCQI